MDSSDGDPGMETDPPPAGKAWLSRPVSLSLLGILTSKVSVIFSNGSERRREPAAPCPPTKPCQMGTMSSQDPEPWRCPRLAGHHCRREHKGPSPGFSPVPSRAHTFSSERLQGSDKAVSGEELSLKAFLAGERETGQGLPAAAFFCSQIRAS